MKKILLAVIAVLFLVGCQVGNTPSEPKDTVSIKVPVLQGGVIGRSITVENTADVVNELYNGTKQLAVVSWDSLEVFPENMTFTETVHGNVVTFLIKENGDGSITYTGYFTDDGTMTVTYWEGLESSDEIPATYEEDGVTVKTPAVPAVVGYPARYKSFIKLAIEASAAVYNFECEQEEVEITDGTVDNTYTSYVYITPKVYNYQDYQVIKRTFDTVILDGIIDYTEVGVGITKDCDEDLKAFNHGDPASASVNFPFIENGEDEYSDTFWARIKAIF